MRIFITELVTVAIALMAGPAEAELVWLEAERFQESGGWTNDAQFIDQMGSPYLMAIGLGTPVENARTRVELPAAGRYRIWVRAKDWVPAYHPGRFQLLVQDRPLKKTFGANRASNVPVSVKTPREEKTIRIDQRKTPPIDDLFISLGSFELSPNDNVVVEISNADTDGYVAVDGLQLVPES